MYPLHTIRIITLEIQKDHGHSFLLVGLWFGWMLLGEHQACGMLCIFLLGHPMYMHIKVGNIMQLLSENVGIE